MAAAVAEASLAHVPAARLVTMQGGDKRNAIPRECSALLVVGGMGLMAWAVDILLHVFNGACRCWDL